MNLIFSQLSQNKRLLILFLIVISQSYFFVEYIYSLVVYVAYLYAACIILSFLLCCYGWFDFTKDYIRHGNAMKQKKKSALL